MVDARGYVKHPHARVISAPFPPNYRVYYTSLDFSLLEWSAALEIVGGIVKRIQQSAETGKGLERGREPAGPVAGELAGRAPISLGEQLDYIADMVRELKRMSAHAHCSTLTGLLELAYHEALQLRRRGQ